MNILQTQLTLTLSFRYRVEDGCAEGYFRCFRLTVKIVFKNLYKHELSLWDLFLSFKLQKLLLWGGFTHLTAKFHLKTSSVMHSNYGFPSFKTPKTPTKMKILEEEKNIASKISKKPWT